MWGNLLQSVGNLVTGHGFQDNRNRAIEDARNTTTTTVGIMRQQSTPRPSSIPSFASLNPIQNPTIPTPPTIAQQPLVSKPNPTAPKPDFSIKVAPKPINPANITPNFGITPKPGFLPTPQKVAQNQQNTPTPNVDANTWNRMAPQTRTNLWNNENAVRNNAPNMSDYGKEWIKNATGLTRTVGGMSVDFLNQASRIPQTWETGLNVLKTNTIDQLPGMERQKAYDIAEGKRITQGYTGLQSGLSNASRFVSGDPNASTNAETEREAQAISSGKGTPGDIFSAIMKSIGLASVVPVSRMAAGARKVEEAVAPAVEGFWPKVGEFFTKERLKPGSKFNPEIGGKAVDEPIKPTVDVPTSEPVRPNTVVQDAVAETLGKDKGIVPGKPSNVVALDRGGSISAPVRDSFTVARDAERSALNQQAKTEALNYETGLRRDVLNNEAKVVDNPVPETPVVDTTIPQTPVEQATQEAAPVTTPVDANGKPIHPLDNAQFGGVTQEAAKTGAVKDPQALSEYVASRSAKYAEDNGVNTAQVLKKIQAANRNKAKSFDEIGLTPAEKDWFLRDQQERNFLRGRADLNENAGGFQKFHSPQQTSDTAYTDALVNEQKRTGGIPLSELDYSGTPSQQYVQRYSNAGKTITDDIVHSIENIPDPLSETGFKPSGITVPDEVKSSIADEAGSYVQKFDERLSAEGPDVFKDLTGDVSDAADAVVVRALEYLKTLPRTAETDAVIAELSKGRGTYVHTYIEANMLGQLGGRAADLINKGIVGFIDKTIGRVTGRMSEGLTGVELSPQTRAGKQVAREWSKGANWANIKQEFNTNNRVLTSKANNWATKLSAKWRSGTTGAVRMADLGTSNAKKAVGYFVREAEDKGMTSVDDINRYVAEKIGSGEYKNVISATESVTNQNIALSTNKDFTNLQSNNLWMHSIGKFIDGLPKKIIEKNPNMPPVARKALESGITRFITGFARVTTTAASKGVDIAAGGVPTMFRGFKALKIADTAAEKVAAARTVQQGLNEAITVGGFVGIGVAMSSMYTGNYPSIDDKNERARWESEGIEANTFRIPVGGDQFISVQPGRLGAFSLPIVIGAALASGKADNPISAAAGLTSQFAQNFGMDQIGNLFTSAGDAMKGDWATALKTAPSIAASVVNGIIPMSGLLNEGGNVTDRTKRDTTGSDNMLVNGASSFVNKLPGARTLLDPKTDVLGNPVQNTNIGLGSWFSAGGVQNDPVSQEINRLSGAKFEVMPGNDVKNTNSQKDGGLLMNSDLYKNADDKTKAEYMHAALLGTKTKDISPTLSDDQRSALIQHSLQSDDKRKVWMENNDNALGYYQSDMENKRVNGVLTAADKDMEKTGSLAQKVAIAGVNKQYNISQDGILAYADTSKGEFNDMADGPEKQALRAYDEALVKAGLPSKYQNKYGGYGATGGGSNGYGSISFAKPLTPSDATSIKSQSLTASTNPFAGLVKTAPSTKTNLRKNISVSKGVHI